jgi:methionyl-tRNA synthetase
MADKYFVTTPIYYVNDKPHIGHAYTTFVADAFARLHRLRGNEVFFSTGVDENSQKNLEAMKKLGKTDLGAYLDEMSSIWKTTWSDLGITNTDFIRTSEQRHLVGVERFWNASMKSGDIYMGTYEGLYCVGCEAFKTETEIVNGHCPLHPNMELQKVSEQNYYFKLSAYREAILELFDKHPEIAMPASRLNEVRNYVSEHFTDISVSRSSKTVEVGIPVPSDPSQRIYVWFDALINYITVVGFGTDDDLVRKWWPADLHLVGKDIIKFHCALWPAMLLSAAKSDPLLAELASADKLIPRRIFAHGYFTLDGVKISKSLGNAIDPRELVPRYGIDAIRYFVMREISFGEDGDFSNKRLEERYTSDLANTLGNLVQRAVSMSRRYFADKVPNVDLVRAGASSGDSVWDGASGIATIQKLYDKHTNNLRFDLALESIWAAGEVKASGLLQANKYVEETKPFKLVTTDPVKVGEILYTLLESCRHYAWLIEPVMPNVAKQIIQSLGQDYDAERAKGLEKLREWGGLAMDSALPEPTPIFPRLVPME